jgi:hypothetical protein
MSLAKRVAEGSALLVSRELFVRIVGIVITVNLLNNQWVYLTLFA